MKPKFLIIQEAGRNADNVCFKEALNLQRAFSRLGVQSGVCGVGYNSQNIELKDYDCAIILENYETNNWIPCLSEFKKPVLFWSIDGHCAFDSHLALCQKHKVDLVLSSCKNVTNKFIANGFKSKWFPNAYPSDLIEYCEEKSIPLGYVGSRGTSERQYYLSELQRRSVIELHIDIIGSQMVKLLNKFLVSFNINLSDDINFRTFESMGAGTLLLTNKTPGIDEIIDPDIIETYSSLDECISKANRLIVDKKDCIIRGFRAYKYAREFHSYDTRAKELLNILERGI